MVQGVCHWLVNLREASLRSVGLTSSDLGPQRGAYNHYIGIIPGTAHGFLAEASESRDCAVMNKAFESSIVYKNVAS